MQRNPFCKVSTLFKSHDVVVVFVLFVVFVVFGGKDGT